jgi:hypothetical protein
MTLPSVAAQLRALGEAGAPLAKPEKREYWRDRKREPIGEKRRAAVRTEEGFYPTWEKLLRLHGLEFWHCTVAQRSQPGWPDYAVFGPGFMAFVELKATSVKTGRSGKLSSAQERWKAVIEAAGGEYRSFTLPGDWPVVDAWLATHTEGVGA